MDSPKNIYYEKNHVEPYRIYLKNSTETLALLDIQIKAELKSLDNPVNQQHSLSVYIKPPINLKYRLVSKDYISSQKFVGQLKHESVVETNSMFCNPYISWHGLGTVHASAYKGKTTKHSKIIVEDRAAIAWNEVTMSPNLILRATIPLADLSHATMLPDKSRSINLISFVKDNSDEKRDINSIILDKSKLVTNIVCVDIFIHNSSYSLKNPDKELPYPKNSEYIWLAPPLVFKNSESVFAPAVSIFIYQPAKDLEAESKGLPITLVGITKKHPSEDIRVLARLKK